MAYTGTIYVFADNVPAPYAAKLRPVYWIMGARISANFPAPYTHTGGDHIPLDAFVHSHRANAVIAKSRGDLIWLDNEAIRRPDVLTACAKIVRDICPAIRMACYGILPDAWAREEWLKADEFPKHPIHDILRRQKPLLNLFDYITLHAYPLNPARDEIDQKAMLAARRVYRQHFPFKPFMWTARGTYHEVHGDGSALPPLAAKAWASVYTRFDDDVCVFDAQAGRDDGLYGALASSYGEGSQ